MVVFEFICYCCGVPHSKIFGDYPEIVDKLLEIDWSHIFDTLSVDDGLIHFRSVLLYWLRSMFQPPTSTRKHSEWIPKPVLHKTRLKKKA